MIGLIDYIVLLLKDGNSIQIVKEMLLSKGIESRKIVVPDMLYNPKYNYQRDLIHKIDYCDWEKVEVLMFGLSYSLRGIVKEELKYNTFDFSWHGLDLYYNLKLLEYASRYISKKAEYAICCFPFDYFNYDMSLSKHQYESGQIMAISGMNDYHNANFNNEYIRNTIDSIKMFSQKYMRFYDVKENIYVTKCINNEFTSIKLGHTWKSLHTCTVNENKQIFRELYSFLEKIAKNIIVVIPPFFMEGIDNIDDFYSSKTLFYNSISEYNLQFFDYSEEFKDKELFADITHLNYKGACLFTELINKILL